MDILIKILQFILSFSLLVIIHECGHFMFARLFGIRVEKFYLFFDPWFSLFKFKKGDTEYGIGWIPFGGYVKIAGMIDESMDTEQMKQPAKSYEFRSKPAWQRLLVMIGGVLMNVILAMCIYIGMTHAWGDKFVDNKDVVYGFVFSDVAKEAGFMDGDKILNVNGEEVGDISKISMDIVLNSTSDVVVLRDGQKVNVHIGEELKPKILNMGKSLMTPRVPFVVHDIAPEGNAVKAGIKAGDTFLAFNGVPMGYEDQYIAAFGENKGKEISLAVKHSEGNIDTLQVLVSDEGLIGVVRTPYAMLINVSIKEYTLLQAIPAGIKRTGAELGDYWKQLKMIVNPKTEAYKSLGGPIAIANIFPGTWNWFIFWKMTAMLSIMLAVINILPIPALDGGHVLFTLYEIVTRRKPSERFLEYAQMVGLILVFTLMFFACGNDIYRFFIK